MIRRSSGSAEDTDNSAPTQSDAATSDKHGINKHGEKKSFTSAKYDVTKQSDTLDRRKVEKAIGLFGSPLNGAYPFPTTDERQAATTAFSKKQFPLVSGQDIDRMCETRDWRRSRARSPWASSLLTISLTVSSALILLFIVHAFLTRQIDPKGCDMCWSRPIYIKFSDFDTEHTRFASKYSLYLYREGGFDEDPKVGVRYNEFYSEKLNIFIRSKVSLSCSYQVMQEVTNKQDAWLSKQHHTIMVVFSGMLRL